MITRRRLLLSGALISTLGGYSHHRGLRYPPLSFDNRELPASLLSSNQFELDLLDCIAVNNHTIRAIAPEPSVFNKRLEGSTSVKVLNVASNAILILDGRASAGIDEDINGTVRTVHIKEANQGATLKLVASSYRRIRICRDGRHGRRLRTRLDPKTCAGVRSAVLAASR